MNNLKLPAQNIDAEESIICSLLTHNSWFDECLDLTPDDFYKTAHQNIFSAMISLYSKKHTVDIISVPDELKKIGLLESSGGGHYLLKIYDYASIGGVKKASEIIKSCSLTRRINILCCNLQDSNLVGDDLLNIAQSEFLKIQSRTTEDNIIYIKDIVQSHIDRIEKANIEKKERGYSLGFPNIDRCLKISDGKLIILAGRPGAGKTSLSITFARNLDKQGIKTGFLSIEMPGEEIIDRCLSMESDVDSVKFGKYNGLKGQDWQNLSDAAAVLYESSMMMDETGSLDIIDVERKCRKMVKNGAQVLFIDQLSQIGNKYIKSGETTSLYSTNCTRIAQLKKELKIPIFLLAQLNRNLTNRGDKEPVLSDLKQTGSLEEDADIVIFIHRPEQYVTDKTQKSILKGVAVINIAKNRAGPTYRDEKIKFVEETTYFYQEE